MRPFYQESTHVHSIFNEQIISKMTFIHSDENQFHFTALPAFPGTPVMISKAFSLKKYQFREKSKTKHTA